MQLKHLIYLLSLLLGSHLVNAQQYSFINHGVEEGLSQSVVNTIIQDDFGYLWLGTMSGLNRFDGRNFEHFDQKDSLAENWISASYKDSRGNIWFGHWAGGLSVYNKERREISNYDIASYSDFKTITSFAEDEKGNLYIGTDGNGILYLNVENSEIYIYNKEGRLSSNYVLDLEIDDQNRLWIATDRGITIKNDNDENTFEVLDLKSGLRSTLINQLQKLDNNKIAVGYYNNGFSIADYSKAKISFKHFIDPDQKLTEDQVQSLYYGGNQELWIGTANHGAILYNIGTDQFQYFGIEQGLNYFSVRSIFKDRESNIWIGTDLGLNLFTGQAFQLYDEKNGLSNNIVWSVCNSAKEGIWVGTNAGLNHLVDGNFKNVSALRDYVIITVFEDREGMVWMGTPGDGVFVYNPRSKELTYYTTDDFLPDNTIYSITQAKDGQIWIGTKKGAVLYNKSTASSETYTIRDGLGGNNIYRIFIDSKNRVWFATLGGELTYKDGDQFKTFGKASGIDQRFIISIAEDQKENLWFGAYGGTIYKYDGNEFSSFLNRDESSSNTPYSIIFDDEQQMWIGNSQGLTRFIEDDQRFKNYGRREGFMGVEANSNASTIDNEGNIWIGTIMGLMKFQPQLIKNNEQEPITLINGIKIHHQESAFPDSAIFQYEDNNFTFEFAGISLTNPGKVLYSYKLDGLEDSFSPESNIAQASYSNLLPGTYALQVKASNNDGLWNKEPAVYEFKVEPPFYMTTWFYILVILAIILLFWLIMRIRTASLKRAKARLEQTVEERTLQLKDRNDELAQKNKDITDSIRYAKRIQTAILPEDTVFKSYLNDSFVYFRPKDIVSGDFYWIDQVAGKTIVTAVDCTGHGVPGAFMSLVGYNSLNKIISEKKETDAAEILLKLDKGVAAALKQTDKEGIKDGMDMSLCVIDHDQSKLQFAGANNPLYAILNEELVEFKGTKQAVGSYDSERSKAYDSQWIDFQKGDQFYLFSDGFADQFGGDHGKKFKTRAFKDLLTKVKALPMDEQLKEIGTTIMKWKGELEQVDDIVVIGFKI